MENKLDGFVTGFSLTIMNWIVDNLDAPLILNLLN